MWYALLILFLVLCIYLLITNKSSFENQHQHQHQHQHIIGGEHNSKYREHMNDAKHPKWILIYSNGCGHCTMQKNILHNNMIKVPQYENTHKIAKALNAKEPIKGFPMWYKKDKNGEETRVYGCMDVGELRKLGIY